MWPAKMTEMCADGAYLKHIASVTGTQVVLKGIGSGNPGNDPLHIFITGGTQEGNDKAVTYGPQLSPF